MWDGITIFDTEAAAMRGLRTTSLAGATSDAVTGAMTSVCGAKAPDVQPSATALPAARPLNMQPPRKVPSSER